LGTYFYDQANKILVNATGKTKIPGCADVELISTPYEDIFLATQDQAIGIPKLRPADLEVATDYQLRDDYIMFELETMVSQATNLLENRYCEGEIQRQQGEPFKFGANYAMVKGSLLYLFSCSQKETKIKEDKVCYRDIPLDTNPPAFVDPLTGILKEHSVVVPCPAARGSR
jgi:hypothetical protein